MKIIHLIYSLCAGGAERFVAGLANAQGQMGHDVQVCILLTDKEEANVFNKQFLNSSVAFHAIGLDPGFNLKKLNLVEQYILSQRPDVVHCHLNVIPYIYRLAFKSRQIKFVHTLHSVAPNTLGSSVQYPLNYLYYRFGYISPVTISDKCDLSYREFYRLHNSVCIENGCESLTSSSLFAEVKNEVESYKRSPDTKVYIHVARFHSLKNQKLLISAFNNLLTCGYDACLLIIGDGFHSIEGAALKELALDGIHFLGLKNNVGDYLKCADAFCLSSVHEGLPISLLESLALGVVPICTRVGGIPDVIEDGKTGILAEPELNSYTAALMRLYTCNIDTNDIKSCYKIHYSMEVCAEKYLSIYMK